MDMSNPQFDVFLSHNSKEKDFVRNVKENLGKLGVKAWLDADDLPLGAPWLPELEKGLRDSRMVAVFVGPIGMGDWQTAEMQVALNHSVTKGKPLIPVLLPGGPEPKELTEFLQLYTVVDFRMGLDNPIELKRLAAAITGKKLDLLEPIPDKEPAPPDKTPVPPDGDDKVQDPTVLSALEYFEGVFDSSVNITFFIGQGINHSGLDSVISPQKISRELMKTLQLIDQDYSQLLPDIDTSSAYYAMGKSDSSLENAVAKQLRVAPDTKLPTYQELSSLLALVGKRGPRRGQHISPQVVVTSNFDLLLERCLLRAGLSFTRLVQYRASPKIEINEYKNVSVLKDGGILVECAGGSAMQAGFDDKNAMDELIATCNRQTLSNAKEFGSSLSLSSLSSPIIYKINGSCDVPNSCIMTIDQHLDFIWRQGKQSQIPDQISEIIKNTPILFLGSRILDPDFRLGYHALLREETRSQNNSRYALLRKPKDGDASDCGYHMLRNCWEPIKKEALKRYAIEIIDVANEEFLELLRQKLAGVIGV